MQGTWMVLLALILGTFGELGEHGGAWKRQGWGGPQDCAQREYLMGGSFREEERRVGGQKPGPEPSVPAESLRILACLLVKAFEQEKRGDLRCWVGQMAWDSGYSGDVHGERDTRKGPEME